MIRTSPSILLAAVVLASSCSGDGGDGPGPCDSEPLPSRPELRCLAEFEAQAARPLDASLPFAMSVKTVIDRAHEDAVHFQDTRAFPLHRSFAVDQLSWPPDLDFTSQYLAPDRRFFLGAITHYERADVWAYELAPYDTAGPEDIAHAYERLAGATFFGSDLKFHPTSAEQEARIDQLPDSIPVVTTDELYAGIDYQPLNLGETIGQVRILTVEELANDYIGPRELAVLDRVPNDISIVAGVVTEEFQTPLSHVNVLSQQRGTPNMGLRGAHDRFAEHEGAWVRLRVGAFEWTVEPATQDEADRWWDEHRPDPVSIRPPDLTVTDLPDLDDVSIDDLAAVGGKAAHFGELRDIGDAVVVPDGFAVPVSFYWRFCEQNGFHERIAQMLDDPGFRGDASVRRAALEALVEAMQDATVDPDDVALVEARVLDQLGDVRVRLRSSTNAEDLEGHSGAGLYRSKGAQVSDPEDPIHDAMRDVWASLWTVRAFEERDWVGIDQRQVAMALLVHPAYTDEAANGVAVTANPFDPGPGGEDGFYLNVQLGEVSVVSPDPGVVADQVVYFHFHAGSPATYLAHSSLMAEGETVMTRSELFDLGRALDAVRDHFSEYYEPPEGFARLPMDVEFKLVDVDGERHVEIKQARPWPGRGSLDD